jgi:hypothetical protein
MAPGLPDGLFSNQKMPFFEGFGMEIFGVFRCHLVFNCNYGIFYGQLTFLLPFWYFLNFGLLDQEKFGDPAYHTWICPFYLNKNLFQWNWPDQV